jgi:imidazolonepropionase-like amidohydrolase
VEAGATPQQALKFGTSGAARLLGLGDELGTLGPGKRADVLAVGGDALRDIHALDEVRLVLRDGVEVASGRRVLP